MCGRYTIITQSEELARRFEVEVPPYYQPKYNAAPSQLLPVVTSESSGGVSLFYWGLAPDRSKNKSISERIINLRAESIWEKPVYRKAIQERRCLVPADGFYEWKKVGKKISVPYRFVLKDRSLFAFAGVWEEYEDEKGDIFHTFSILTTAPNALVAPIHNRMPVILERAAEKAWLSTRVSDLQISSMLGTFSASEMDAYTVSPRVNSALNEDASLVLPAPPADQHGNLTLFG